MLDIVENILEQNIRPYLGIHDGNIKIVSIKDGVVKARFLGQCSCCPSARLTFEELVRTEIVQNVPGVKDVILESNISEDMIAFAKKILNGDI